MNQMHLRSLRLYSEISLFEQLFRTDRAAMYLEVGPVEGKYLSGGSFVEANAKESRISSGTVGGRAQVHYSLREYLRKLEQQNSVAEPVHEQEEQVS